ncbi:MAG: hypothetical protein KIT84_35010 [Labilithrix sp.]|nr:hypothetical protein [Labilithrix sp.]MCW5816260.1 hypothetical protein [Labilithrix sp.]
MKPRERCLLTFVSAVLLFTSGAAAQEGAPARDTAEAHAPPPHVDGAAPADPPRLTAEDPAPLGRAAPPTEAGSRAVGPLKAGLEVFAQYMYRSVAGGSWFHVFDVPRVHGAVEGEYEHARGRVVVEAVRSAAEGALVGVAGDSLVLRVREAWASYRPVVPLEVSAGVIPTLTVPDLDGTWMMRVVAPSGLESSALMTPADLGAKARVELPAGYGWVATAFTNGDGYTSRELNRGKTTEVAAEGHPLANVRALRPLAFLASYVGGSTGTSLARANRVTGGALWQGERIRAGVYATHAWGVAQLGTQRAILASAFVRLEPIPRLLLAARADHWIRNTGAEQADRITTLWLAAGYRVALPIEVFLAADRALPTARAASEVPGSDAWQLRVIGRVVF